MSIKIAINGFGRIGRLVLRAFNERNIKNAEIVAINDLGSIEANAHLFNYDTTHGISANKVKASRSGFIIGNKKIEVLSERSPEKLPWKKFDIDIVLECTGIFTSKEKAKTHISAGAKKVIMIEPEPAFFESAKQNIELNKELQNIEIHNLVLSSTIGIYMIDHKQRGDLGEINESKENGIPIPKITIDKFLSNYHEQNFVLKMDCESCEYDVLLPIPEDTLRKFEQIFIEFHNGCLNISQRLEKSGFSSITSESHFMTKVWKANKPV